MVLEAFKNLRNRFKIQKDIPLKQEPQLQQPMTQAFAQIPQQPIQLPELPSERGLSPFQKRIIRRELLMKRIRETPPLERSKMLRESDPYYRRIKEIRGIPDQPKSQIIIDSKVQQAQRRLKDKITEANMRTKKVIL